MITVLCKEYEAPAVNIREVLRYAKCSSDDTDCSNTVKALSEETKNSLTYRVCYAEFAVTVTDDVVDMGFCKTTSHALAANLKDCKRVIVFAATCGSAYDMLLRKASVVSPAKAFFLQALGSERVEALCDLFNEEIARTARERASFIRPRFSPGYGDLSLSVQKDIFRALNPEKYPGITLSDRLIMSPSKSVTAIIGLEKSILGVNYEN